MGSFLKRSSTVAQLQDRILEKQSKVFFDLEEPDFVLKRKFGSNSKVQKTSITVQSHLNGLSSMVCPQCGNNQISAHSKFCKICGYELVIS